MTMDVHDDRLVCPLCKMRARVVSKQTPYRIRCAVCGWEATDIYSLDGALRRFSGRLVRRDGE